MDDEKWYHKEPVIHSFVTDMLPDSHPNAYKFIDCAKCGCTLHAANNECMTVWIEWGPYAVCFDCAAPVFDEPLSSASQLIAHIKNMTLDEYLMTDEAKEWLR